MTEPLLISDAVGDTSDFTYRESVRAIITNTKGEMALLLSTKFGTHKLPGGGCEPGESREESLLRELQEEIGYSGRIVGELGESVEYRGGAKLHQISYCYICEVVGNFIGTAHTEREIEFGTEIMWVLPSEAAERIAADPTSNYAGWFIKQRDVYFVTKYLEQVAR